MQRLATLSSLTHDPTPNEFIYVNVRIDSILIPDFLF